MPSRWNQAIVACEDGHYTLQVAADAVGK